MGRCAGGGGRGKKGEEGVGKGTKREKRGRNKTGLVKQQHKTKTRRRRKKRYHEERAARGAAGFRLAEDRASERKKTPTQLEGKKKRQRSVDAARPLQDNARCKNSKRQAALLLLEEKLLKEHSRAPPSPTPRDGPPFTSAAIKHFLVVVVEASGEAQVDQQPKVG